jgi:hypothetical protein
MNLGALTCSLGKVWSRAGLCSWDNRGKANSWRPLPPVNKNLPHTWTTMRQLCYGGKAEMWSVRAMHTLLSWDLRHHATVLRINVWPGGDCLFGTPSKSAPGARALLAPPIGQHWCGAIPTLSYTPDRCGATCSTSMSAEPYLPARMLDATRFWNSKYCNPWQIQKCQYGEFSVV